MENYYFLSLLLSIGIIICLIGYIFLKLQTISSLKTTMNKLNREIEELDEQAKLIIKSDVELKLYQEEVEDKLNKLTLLRNLLTSSLNSLDARSLFSNIDEELINKLGFKKALLLFYPDYRVELNINCSPQEQEIFIKLLQEKSLLLNAISVLSPKYLEKDENIKKLINQLSFSDFLCSSINVGSKIYAILILAQCILPFGVTQAEEEMFSIICMYLGQCLDNIKLFEAQFNAGIELEAKIKEKTFQLTKTIDEIEEISKLKSEFISSVSHELRTPLTSIKGFSRLLVSGKFGKLPPEAAERLKRIDKNADKLVNMVNTLLDISRIESKKVEIRIAPANINRLIKDASELLLPQIINKKISLKLETEEPLNVYMDKDLIERVLINIINNAIKFTPEKGEITVGCKRYNNNEALIYIKDTGCGMNPEECTKVFKEFFRSDNPINKQVRGTGLGLSLVKKIIETHNEKIWVESEVNKGTTFYFTLKLAR